MINGYMSVSEASKILGVNTSRVRQLLGGGKLDGEKVNPRCWVVSEDSVRSYAAERRRELQAQLDKLDALVDTGSGKAARV